MSIGEIIATIVLGAVGSLIAAFLFRAYETRCDKVAFEAESIALNLLNLAVSILPEEDRAKLSDQWLADVVYLDTSLRRIQFASGLPLAALKLRSKASFASLFAASMKFVRSISNAPPNQRSEVTRNPVDHLGQLRAAKRSLGYTMVALILILGAWLAAALIGEALNTLLPVSPVQPSGLTHIPRLVSNFLYALSSIGSLVIVVCLAYSVWLYLTAKRNLPGAM